MAAALWLWWHCKNQGTGEGLFDALRTHASQGLGVFAAPRSPAPAGS